MTKSAIGSSLMWFVFTFLNFQTGLANPLIHTKVDSHSFTSNEVDIMSGQLMMIGFSGTEISNEEIQLFKEIKPGGVILFKRNIINFQQLIKLNLMLQKLSLEVSGQPLFIALDQEGGRVNRLQIDPTMPSPLAFGMAKNASLVEQASFESARLLRAIGVNMNLAPVLDIVSKNSFSFISERSFGFDVRSVSDLGGSFAQGQLRAGVIPTSKHFPGAGSIQRDPHVEKVVDNKISTQQLEPFKIFSQIYPSAIMMSHAVYPQLDPTNTPATYSKKIMKSLLRNDWGYRGLIITDDLLMKGADFLQNRGESAARSINAGTDIVMVSWGRKSQLQVKQTLKKHILTGKISIEDINDKINRISSIKKLLKINLSPRIPASELAVYESKKMSELDNAVLEANLNKDLSDVNFNWTDEYALITSDLNFSWGFERALGKKISNIRSEDLNKLESKTLLKRSQIIIAPVQNKKSFYTYEFLPHDIKRKMVLILVNQPLPVKEDNYLSVVKLFHPHKALPRKLGELIRNKSSF